ncbi:unnamed protein product [Lupinus luteus]|uniref:Uncharacterized protein n=1 Tax=Lupinus luteus TaxID=3873 RepID=A0AAV1Y216_LUPLU
MNRASLLKLTWDMRSSPQDWACFYRQRFGCNWSPSTRFFKSSIWPGIKENWYTSSNNAIWLVGEGHGVNFWLDNWIGEPIVDLLNIPMHLQPSLKANCSSFIDGSRWIIPTVLKNFSPSICNSIAATKRVDNDILIW